MPFCFLYPPSSSPVHPSVYRVSNISPQYSHPNPTQISPTHPTEKRVIPKQSSTHFSISDTASVHSPSVVPPSQSSPHVPHVPASVTSAAKTRTPQAYIRIADYFSLPSPVHP